MDDAMENKHIEELVEKANQIFGKTSIYEVMDLDRDAAIMTLVDYYGPTRYCGRISINP